MASDSETVETERLLLVPWADAYFDDFARICSQPEVMRFVSRGKPLPRDVIEDIHNRTLSMWDVHGFGPWAAFERQTGLWVGRIGLNLLRDWPRDDKWEVGYELDQPFWGRGYATEGARRTVRYGWDRTDLNRIISVTTPDNLASRRVMEKSGLKFQAEVPFRGTTVVWYAIDRPHA